MSSSSGTSWSHAQTSGPYDLSVPRVAGSRGSERTVWGGNFIVVKRNGQRLVLTSQEFQSYVNAGADIEPVGPGH